jgi:hypothetical protein
MRTEMDYLVLGDYLLDKSRQPLEINKSIHNETFGVD